MNSRDYECVECKCWFTIYDALWSECSLRCPLCQEKVKHLRSQNEDLVVNEVANENEGCKSVVNIKVPNWHLDDVNAEDYLQELKRLNQNALFTEIE